MLCELEAKTSFDLDLKLQEIAAAHAVLSDPQKRQKYDARGFTGLETSDLDLQVCSKSNSIAQLGPQNSISFSELYVQGF